MPDIKVLSQDSELKTTKKTKARRKKVHKLIPKPAPGPGDGGGAEEQKGDDE